MPIEVTCGQCHGPLLVEQGGVVVACPTCGAHLDIPADIPQNIGDEPVEAGTTDAETSSLAAEVSVDADVREEPASVSEPQEFVSHSSPYLNHLASLPASLSGVSQPDVTTAPLEVDTGVANVFPVTEAATALPDVVATIEPEAIPPANPFALDGASVPAIEPFATSIPAGISAVTAATALAETITQPPETTIPVVETAPMVTSGDGVSRQTFFYLATYASAMTLVVLYLLYSMLTHREHALESLPDIEPPMQQGKIGMKTAKPSDDVPRGHVLRIGESQRFGSVRVTPLRITRGPVTFEHLFGDRKMVRDPSKPVYKLWLRFENVSPDQEFVPLSTLLVYKRHSTGLGKYKTNNFLASESERTKKEGDIYYLFGLSENSEFALSGQKLDQALAPGASWETFLAAEDGLDGIEGDWTWRVFFRKGYNPKSHRGVTTVIDVRFDGKDVSADTPAA